MFNYKSKNPDVDMKTGFYNRCFFDLRLCEERRRTERSGLPFSVLTMDISDLADSVNRHRNLKLLKIKKAMSAIVRENCRTIDIKTWYGNTTLKILLPETSLTDAHVLSRKLHKIFNNGFRPVLGIKNTFDLKKNTTISSFPEFIVNSENGSGSKTAPVLKASVKGGTSTILTMKWDPLNQPSLTWPLYSDLLKEYDLPDTDKWIKRSIDIMGALIGIILFSPVMLVIAILIKITSSGPVLFKQERMGFPGKKFTFLKFRSMYTDCSEERHRQYVTNLIKNTPLTTGEEAECKPVYKMDDDPRITPFGNFLRKSSLDELPQLINVLKGEMSLVGPRPPIPYEVEKYENWHFRRVLEVKPGITGLWQVEGRSRTTFNEMVRLDIAYVNNFSLWLDLKILFKTIWVVLSGKGAY
ncbi:MAG: exopolysaccharide biosynthesis polyprenyl glycosylphosphotransferase [Deltaproteobacteria bacterium]|nr:exopolysaccharide biosynthesis polyprenyl glycosylphosphotransferase [Deltaproteobacteria bacterium]